MRYVASNGNHNTHNCTKYTRGKYARQLWPKLGINTARGIYIISGSNLGSGHPLRPIKTPTPRPISTSRSLAPSSLPGVFFTCMKDFADRLLLPLCGHTINKPTHPTRLVNQHAPQPQSASCPRTARALERPPRKLVGLMVPGVCRVESLCFA